MKHGKQHWNLATSSWNGVKVFWWLFDESESFFIEFVAKKTNNGVSWRFPLFHEMEKLKLYIYYGCNLCHQRLATIILICILLWNNAILCFYLDSLSTVQQQMGFNTRHTVFYANEFISVYFVASVTRFYQFLYILHFCSAVFLRNTRCDSPFHNYNRSVTSTLGWEARLPIMQIGIDYNTVTSPNCTEFLHIIVCHGSCLHKHIHWAVPQWASRQLCACGWVGCRLTTTHTSWTTPIQWFSS